MSNLILQSEQLDPKREEKRIKLEKLRARNAANGGKTPEPKLRVLSLGWGVQSFTLAAMSALGELPKLDLLIHADTSWERAATYKFAEKWTPWLEAHGLEVVSACSLSARNTGKKEYTNVPVYMEGERSKVQLARQCTSRWKIDVVRQLIRQELAARNIKTTENVVEQWLGISWDEASRAKNSEVGYITSRHPFLEDATRMTRFDCIKWLEAHGLQLPVKSACTHCAYHSQKHWQAMKRENGIDWKQAISFDELVRDANKKIGKQLFIHKSLRPLVESVPLPEEAGYTQPDLIDGPGCDSAGYCWD